jgi:cell division septation protein DedD
MLLGVVCLVWMSGCSRERIDWKSAEAADTQEAYNHFLELHPSGELATQARARLTQLAEDKDWQRTIAADTADAYKQFLAEHPGGKWAEEARIRAESFSLAPNASPTGDSVSASSSASPTPAPASSSPRSTTAAPGTPAEPPPAPAPRSEAPSNPKLPPATPPAASTAPPASSEPPGFGIQLGAFSTQAAALAEWKRLQVKFDPQLHGLFAHAVPAQVTSGKVFSLQSPVGEESRARSICAALTKQAQPCVVVLPNSQ